MTTSTLNKVYDGDVLWETPNFSLERGGVSMGYLIINKNTGITEMQADHETSGVLTILWLEDSYQEVMEDPEKEFQRRQAMKHSATTGPSLVQ